MIAFAPTVKLGPSLAKANEFNLPVKISGNDYLMQVKATSEGLSVNLLVASPNPSNEGGEFLRMPLRIFPGKKVVLPSPKEISQFIASSIASDNNSLGQVTLPASIAVTTASTNSPSTTNSSHQAVPAEVSGIGSIPSVTSWAELDTRHTGFISSVAPVVIKSVQNAAAFTANHSSQAFKFSCEMAQAGIAAICVLGKQLYHHAKSTVSSYISLASNSKPQPDITEGDLERAVAVDEPLVRVETSSTVEPTKLSRNVNRNSPLYIALCGAEKITIPTSESMLSDIPNESLVYKLENIALTFEKICTEFRRKNPFSQMPENNFSQIDTQFSELIVDNLVLFFSGINNTRNSSTLDRLTENLLKNMLISESKLQLNAFELISRALRSDKETSILFKNFTDSFKEASSPDDLNPTSAISQQNQIKAVLDVTVKLLDLVLENKEIFLNGGIRRFCSGCVYNMNTLIKDARSSLSSLYQQFRHNLLPSSVEV